MGGFFLKINNTIGITFNNHAQILSFLAIPIIMFSNTVKPVPWSSPVSLIKPTNSNLLPFIFYLNIFKQIILRN